jgi:hypothetical protein
MCTVYMLLLDDRQLVSRDVYLTSIGLLGVEDPQYRLEEVREADDERWVMPGLVDGVSGDDSDDDSGDGNAPLPDALSPVPSLSDS